MSGPLLETTLVGGPRPSPAIDRASAYGDGVFETLLLHRGRSPFLPLHKKRLNEAASRLGLRPPASLWSTVQAQFDRLSETPFALAKLSVSRQSAGRGYAPGSGQCHIHLSVFPADAPWQHRAWREGAYLELSKLALAIDPALAAMKHLNRLPQVLAAAELGTADEHLMLDTSGRVIEGTKSNLIMINSTADGDGIELISPRLDEAGVNGVTRQWLRQAVSKGELGETLVWREANVSPAMLSSAAEIVVCNSAIGIWPVRRIGCMHKAEPVISRQLQSAWRSKVEEQSA